MQPRLFTLLSLALGSAIIVAPGLSNIGSDSFYDSAFAAKGGNGKGKGGQSANGNGSSNAKANGNGKSSSGSKSASAGTAGSDKSKKEKSLTSQMGALNAAHASANALRNASPDSRVGMIAAYGQQAAVAAAAQQVADVAAQAAADAVTALDQLNADFTAGLIDQATYDSQLTSLQMAAEAAAADAAALQAAADAADAQAASLLEAAANKTPVTEEVRAAVDALLEGKIEPVAVPTTPQ
jgi:hypothetical protein